MGDFSKHRSDTNTVTPPLLELHEKRCYGEKYYNITWLILNELKL